jgi:hypothetical protein
MHSASRELAMTVTSRAGRRNVLHRPGRAPITRALLAILAGCAATFLVIMPVAAQGVITGRVVADSTGRPLAGAEVSIAGGSVELASALTDSAGRFRLSLPAASSFRLAVRRTGYELLTTVALTPDAATAGVVELVLRPARGNLDGLIRGRVTDSTGRAIPFALVRVGTTGERITDDSGRFDAAVRNTGRLPIAVRRVGYRALETTLAGLPDTSITLVLAPLAGNLETVRIVEDQTVNSLELNGFYRRMREKTRGANTGHFITPEDIERRPVSRVTQLVEGLRGVQVLLISPKSYAVFGTNRCPMEVYLDGARLTELRGVGGSERIPTEFDHLISTTSVAGIEVYTRANIPEQYRALNATCGVVLIWTK